MPHEPPWADVEPGDTRSTESTEATALDRAPSQPALVVVLSGANPALGGLLVPLRGVQRIDVARGEQGMQILAGEPGSLRLLLPDPKISARHGRLEVRQSALIVHDSASKNGCYVGGERVLAPTAAVDGAPITLGHTLLVFRARAALPSRDPWPFPTASAAFAHEMHKLARIAPTPLPVLLLGETGTGKEVVARAIHRRSGRPGPFVAVNCGALPSGLVEAQLFGHKRGAFSGASSDAPGYFRAAHQGTLLLDEVGDLPLSAQAALLRVLQEGEVSPVGAVAAQKIDVRVVAATHKPLDRLVEQGHFRADLYARLRGFVTTIPPLRERRDDLGHLVAAITREQGLQVRLAADAVEALYSRDFCLNVRELSHSLVAAASLADGAAIRADHLPPPTQVRRPAPARPQPAPDEADEALRDELSRRLQEAGGNVSQVARDMGKARQQIQRWMRRFGLRGA